MKSHQLRLILIAALFGVVTLAAVVGSAMGASETVLAGLGSSATLLLAALVDSAMVERRRRDPFVPAISDDVRKAPGSSKKLTDSQVKPLDAP